MNSSWSDKVAYLVQGRSELVQEEFRYIEFGPNVIVLTWDFEIPEDVFPVGVTKFFFPNSTWAEGRNKLLELAASRYRNIEYFVFLDDDIAFTKSSLNEFERLILEFQPKIAVPLCDRIVREMSFSQRSLERPIRHDQILMAFHRSVLEDKIALPIDTQFDEISWWLTAVMNHYLIQKFYFDGMLSFNDVVIRNTNHGHEVTEPALIDKSLYRARFTVAELEAMKLYIRSKYGAQPATLDTIFQPKVFEKLRVVNLNKLHIEHLFLMARQGKVSHFLKLLIKIASTYATNGVYRVIWPQKIFSARIKSL